MINKNCSTFLLRSLLAASFCVLSGITIAAELKVVAGNGEPGFVDGKDARLNKPIRLAPFGSGRIVIADINNNAIRVVSIDGEVITLAGGPDKKGHRDGDAAQAMFSGPHGVAVSPDGVIAVASANNHVVRLMTPTKDNRYTVSTLAGVVGKTGSQDGAVATALFNSPHGVAWEGDGALLVVDIGNATIRRIKDGVVTTVLRASDSQMEMPIDLMPAGDGSFLIADAGSAKALRWVPDGTLTAASPETELVMPHGISGDGNGIVYVAEMNAHRIARLGKKSSTIVAGTGEAGSSIDQLNKPAAVLVHDGYLWIADLNNHRISVLKL
jgi:DNA-binding beta-propeller fold protein YncE